MQPCETSGIVRLGDKIMRVRVKIPVRVYEEIEVEVPDGTSLEEVWETVYVNGEFKDKDVRHVGTSFDNDAVVIEGYEFDRCQHMIFQVE